MLMMTGNAKIKTFRAASWQSVREEVYLPAWHKLIAEHADSLPGVRPADFSRLSGDLVSFGRKFAPRNELPPLDALKRRGAEILGSALAYSLYKHGWTLLPETARKRGLSSGTSAQWRSRRAERGVKTLTSTSRQKISHGAISCGAQTTTSWRRAKCSSGLCGGRAEPPASVIVFRENSASAICNCHGG